jgi:hypothetical protein
LQNARQKSYYLANETTKKGTPKNDETKPFNDQQKCPPVIVIQLIMPIINGGAPRVKSCSKVQKSDKTGEHSLAPTKIRCYPRAGGDACRARIIEEAGSHGSRPTRFSTSRQTRTSAAHKSLSDCRVSRPRRRRELGTPTYKTDCEGRGGITRIPPYVLSPPHSSRAPKQV